MTMVLVPGRDESDGALAVLRRNGAGVADFMGHAHWLAQQMPPDVAEGDPEAVARGALALVGAGLPPPGVPALPDRSALPGEPYCMSCGRGPGDAANGLVAAQDGPRCDDADECAREQAAREPWFRQRWRDLWYPSAGFTGWHWAEHDSHGLGDSHAPPEYEDDYF